MNILLFLNSFGLGGTEKAACRWAMELFAGASVARHQVAAVALEDGPRRKALIDAGIETRVATPRPESIRDHLRSLRPDVIHAHCPGYPHKGDILGEALTGLGRRIPVVQTNIFGLLQNPREDAWTDFRLFISWTSCVQAARRNREELNADFFRRKSVAVYPVDPVSPEHLRQLRNTADVLRAHWGIRNDEVLFGRFSRPEPNKWTDLPLQGFTQALKSNSKIKLLLREPPPLIAAHIRNSALTDRILILPTTADSNELQASQMACDAILHGSSIGESFGYGIAEPMALGKPVIAHSVPWQDQAQIELVRDGECGFIASTRAATARSVLRLAEQPDLRESFGAQARCHIQAVADPTTSVRRLETTLTCALENRDNPQAEEDLDQARKTAAYLDQQQWGHSLGEYAYLMAKDRSARLVRRLRTLKSSRSLSLVFAKLKNPI